MGLYILAGVAAFLLLWLLARWFATVPASELARAVRTFIAVFSALASTGLIWMGRFGLALVTLAATVMAIRSLLNARRGADPLDEDTAGPQAEGRSRVRTRLVEMELERATGRLEGRVLAGRFAGRRLSDMSFAELLEFYGECSREDPDAARLVEAYLDRRDPDWRTRRQQEERRQNETPGATMDEATAYAILGLAPGAGEEEIKAAYRRLMAKLHPDHGGSSFLASQLNRAREVLLRRRR